MSNQITTLEYPKGYQTKVAWIRNQSIPAGQPAPGHLNCPCGNAPETNYSPDTGNVACACGRVYTWDGYIIQGANSIQVRVPFVNKVETFRPVGIGAYPYECIAKDKHPDSMIYVSEAYGNGWIASHQLIDTGLGYFELGVA